MMTTAQIQAAIVQSATAHGIDPNLALQVAQAESNFNQSAVSPAGAIGVMQLMPATAAGLGVDPADPAQNIDAGVSYLAQLLGQYSGNTALALAAYNAGPGNVAKYGGVPPFAETQSYVAKILTALGLQSASPDVPAATDGSGSGTDTGSYASAIDVANSASWPAWAIPAVGAGVALLAWLILD